MEFQLLERRGRVGGTGELQSASLVLRRPREHLGVRGLGERIDERHVRRIRPLTCGPILRDRRLQSFAAYAIGVPPATANMKLPKDNFSAPSMSQARFKEISREVQRPIPAFSMAQSPSKPHKGPKVIAIGRK